MKKLKAYMIFYGSKTIMLQKVHSLSVIASLKNNNSMPKSSYSLLLLSFSFSISLHKQNKLGLNCY